MIETSGHLPECPVSVPRYTAYVKEDCICGELRACEQRLRREGRFTPDDYDLGFTAGVQAARDAVARLGEGRSHKPFNPNYAVWSINQALAAIDALTQPDAPHDDPCDCDECIAAARQQLHALLRDEADERSE